MLQLNFLFGLDKILKLFILKLCWAILIKFQKIEGPTLQILKNIVTNLQFFCKIIGTNKQNLNSKLGLTCKNLKHIGNQFAICKNLDISRFLFL